MGIKKILLRNELKVYYHELSNIIKECIQRFTTEISWNSLPTTHARVDLLLFTSQDDNKRDVISCKFFLLLNYNYIILG